MSRQMVERSGIEQLQRLGFSPDVSFTRFTPRKWALATLGARALVGMRLGG